MPSIMKKPINGLVKNSLDRQFFFLSAEVKKQIVEIFIATWFQFNAHKRLPDYDSINCRATVPLFTCMKRVMFRNNMVGLLVAMVN